MDNRIANVMNVKIVKPISYKKQLRKGIVNY